MQTRFSVSVRAVGIGGLFLVFGMIFTTIFFIKYQNSNQVALKYKQMYIEMKQKYDLQEMIKTQKIILGEAIFPKVKLKLLKDMNYNVSDIMKGEGYTVVVFFSDFDCGTCMQRELHIWQDFFEKHYQLSNVIGIARTSNPTKLWRDVRGIVSFPTYLDASLDASDRSIFEILRITLTPTILFVENKTHKVLDVHFGEAGRDKESYLFRDKVLKWFKSTGSNEN